MKKRSVILSVVLALVGMLSVFTVTGCGVSTNDLKKSFDSMAETYANYSQVFTSGIVNGHASQYYVNYSEKINGYISSHREGFDDLDDIFNATFDLSARYIDENKEVILNYNEKNLTKSAKKMFKTLNKSIKKHKKQIKKFVSARESLVFYFSHFDLDDDPFGSEYHIGEFKKAYAKFASSSIALANNLAKTIEKTEIFDLLRSTETTDSDVGLVKGYIEMKLLKIYNSAILNEITSKIDWSVYEDKNARLKDLVENMHASLDYFNGHLAGSTSSLQSFDKDKMNELLDKTEEFITESGSFLKALYDFNFSKCAINYDNDLDDYVKANRFALVDVDKMEQFVNITLNNFMKEVEEFIYQ